MVKAGTGATAINTISRNTAVRGHAAMPPDSAWETYVLERMSIPYMHLTHPPAQCHYGIAEIFENKINTHTLMLTTVPQNEILLQSSRLEIVTVHNLQMLDLELLN